MVVAKNAMEIFTVLDKSNCRKCGEKTCLAFAGAVFLGVRKIGECPTLAPQDLERFSGDEKTSSLTEPSQDEYVDLLKNDITQLDYAEVAERIKGQVINGELTIPILGKKFGIDKDGTFITTLHVLPWVVNPILDYVLNCKGVPVSGTWISLREIPGGKEKYGLFKKRGEDVLKKLADKYTDFFDDIIHMFSGAAVEEQFESDVSVVLYPFPRVPIMICYWKPEEEMASSLNLFFDASVNENLGLEAAFFLGTGLAQMFEKLAEQHGF